MKTSTKYEIHWKDNNSEWIHFSQFGEEVQFHYLKDATNALSQHQENHPNVLFKIVKKTTTEEDVI